MCMFVSVAKATRLVPIAVPSSEQAISAGSRAAEIA
jgi:hypothetical protein